MRIAMIGAGYVGLVSGACLADAGHHVTLVDISEERIARLRRGDMPIFEPGLAAMVESNARAERIAFTTDIAYAVTYADAVFIAVGTPQGDDGHADLTAVFAVARQLAPHLSDGAVVVTKSTVPVGTGDAIERIIADVAPSTCVHVVSNPEFLREGAAIDDFKRPDRVVVGTHSDVATQVMTAIYAPITDRVLFTDRRSSELIKYAANAFLAMKVTFINEMADLCEAVGADIRSLAFGIGMDKRIGGAFLQPGPGYGGSCFPKDTMALVRTAHDVHSPLSLIDATILANEGRKRAMAQKIIAACGGSVAGKTIGLLGLTFKARTDDMRDSPAITIVEILEASGASVRAYDPEGSINAKAIMPNVRMCISPAHVAHGSDALVLVTDWPEFGEAAYDRYLELMDGNVFVDLRNMLDAHLMHSLGYKYTGIGIV